MQGVGRSLSPSRINETIFPQAFVFLTLTYINIYKEPLGGLKLMFCFIASAEYAHFLA